jgi:hypothetical protein
MFAVVFEKELLHFLLKLKKLFPKICLFSQ